METGFRADFSDVRVHSNDESSALSKQVGAKAFTLGRDIVFDQRMYQPESFDGRKLLAHELVHTLQQGGRARTIQRAPNSQIAYSIINDLISGRIATTYRLAERIAGWTPEELQLFLDALRVVVVEGEAQERIYMAMDLIHETLGPEEFDPKKENADLVGPEARRRAAGSGRWSADPDESGKTLKRKTQRTYVRYGKRKGEGRGVGCMVAVYGGLRNLLPPEKVDKAQDETTREGYLLMKEREESKSAAVRNDKTDTITLSRFISKLRPEGMVGGRMRFEYSARAGTWKPDVEDTLLDKTAEEKIPGLYFFAVSLNSYHTGIVMVDRTIVDEPKLFWLDQSGGISQKLSLKNGLTKYFKETHADYGYPPTFMWMIMPPDEVVVH